MSDEDDNSSDDEREDISLPGKLLETAIALKTGLPPQAQRSFWKVFGRVFTAAAELPATYLEGRARIVASKADIEVARHDSESADIRSQQKARDVVNQGTAKIAVQEFANPKLAQRAASYHAEHILVEQTRREQIFCIAAEELKEQPPEEDSKSEIEDDVLEAILREGATRSSEDFKVLFGRILAGEIKRPGSFSIGTIQSLGRLTRETAEIFQSLCNVSTSGFVFPKVITDPFGHAGNNVLTQFGLSFFQLARLIEEGLIRTDFSEWQDIMGGEWQNPILIEHAGTSLTLTKNNEEGLVQPPPNLRVSGVSFTRAGQELRGVVTMTPSDQYLGHLARWLRSKGVVLNRTTKHGNAFFLGPVVEPLAS